MKCYLHIGAPKTATTTIQFFLLQNKALLEKYGYSIIAPTHYDNRDLLFAFLDKFNPNCKLITDFYNVNKQEEFDIRKKYAITLLQNSLNNIKTDNCIISSEAFSSDVYTIEDIYNIKDILSHFKITQFKIIYYIRDQIDMYPSALSTGIHSNFVMTEETRMFEFDTIIKLYEEVFGKENMCIKIFDKTELFNNDISSDFLSSIDTTLDLSLFKSAQTYNQSLSFTGMNLLSYLHNSKNINQTKSNFDVNNIKKFVIRDAIAKYFTANKKYILEAEKFNQIKEEYQDCNEWIKQNYFPNKKTLFIQKKPDTGTNELTISNSDIENIINAMIDISKITPAVSHTDKTFIVGNLLKFVDSLEENLVYAIYGYGTIAKSIQRLSKNSESLLFFDDNVQSDNVHKLNELNTLKDDKIIITPLGRESDIKMVLVGQYNIDINKIISIPM